MRFCTVVLAVIVSLGWVNAQADTAPVVDLNDLPDNSAPVSNSNRDTLSAPASVPDPIAARQALPMDQRMRLLEQQISNFTQMNLPAKVDNLEQQIHQLNGQLEEQTHTIQQLQDQLQKRPITGTDTSAAASAASVATPKAKDEKPVDPPVAAVTTSTHHAESATQTTKPTTSASPILAAETAVVQNKATAVPSASTDSDEKAYQTAFDMMVKKQTTSAITAFKTFLKNYPNSAAYAPNAHYWLGELYSTSNKSALASKEFTVLIQQYPTHAKVPDAMLKLAIIHDDAGKHADAKQELQKVIAQFPNSTAAKLAKMRLKGMKAAA